MGVVRRSRSRFGRFGTRRDPLYTRGSGNRSVDSLGAYILLLIGAVNISEFMPGSSLGPTGGVGPAVWGLVGEHSVRDVLKYSPYYRVPVVRGQGFRLRRIEI